MLKYTLIRILQMIPVLLGVMVIVFSLSYMMPGDPVLMQMPDNYTQEYYDEVKHDMGLDRPYIVQLGSYIWGVVTRLDLGTSYMTNRAVTEQISERVWVSVRIGLISVFMTALLGIPFGIIAAVKQNSPLDVTVSMFAVFLASVPGFWLALMGIIVFSIKLNILPASGLTSWKHYILPVISNGMMSIAGTTRMMRSTLLEVIRQDYIRTARAKGLKQSAVTRRHALKNGLIPVITVIGSQLSMIMGGSILVETIYSVPGLGTLMNTAISSKNYPVVQSGILVISITVCIMNLVVDLAYAFIDPRIKAQYTSGKKKKKEEEEPKPAAQEVA